MTFINEKPPACEDIFKCSLPKDQQDTCHMQTYHESNPVVVPNLDPSLPDIMVHRDLKAARASTTMASLLPTLTRRQSCRDRQAASIVAPPQQTHPTRRPSQRQRRPTLHCTDQPSSSPSSARLAAAPFPPTGSALNSNNATSSAVTQLLPIMVHIADTVDRLDKRLDKRLDEHIKTMSGMSEQMEWVMNQVDEIRTQNASMEAHTEFEDELKGLWKLVGQVGGSEHDPIIID